jgi:hypothetical protein
MKVKEALLKASVLALALPTLAFAEDTTTTTGTVVKPAISMSFDPSNIITTIVGIGGAVVGVSAVIYGIRKIKSLIAG